MNTEKPLAALSTIYFGNIEKRQFFKQNGITGGTYVECWVKPGQFAHILTSVELGNEEKLKQWMEDHQLAPCTEEIFMSHFFQLCREVDDKREKLNTHRQKQFAATTPTGEAMKENQPLTAPQ